jgi:hypothetical protein
MRKSIVGAIAFVALTLTAGPALADPVIVDEPDTSGLNNTWTFAPLGIPVIGLVQSIVRAPNGLLPS